MTITTYTSFKEKLDALRQDLPFVKNSITTVVGQPFSMWATAPDAGTAPSTAVVPTSSTAGAIPGLVVTGGEARVGRVTYCASSVATWMLCDRLSHQGGLSGTTTPSSTTNLPTAALTRYTSGIGVFAALEIYTQIGTTLTATAIDYVDQDNVTRLSPDVSLGNTGLREAGRFIVYPYVQGTTGLKSVSGYRQAASTGTIGNMGITLFKPLLSIHVEAGQQNMVQDQLLSSSAVERVFDNACLFWVCLPNVTVSGQITGAVHLIES